MEDFIKTVSTELGSSVPNILYAILTLIVGWLIAVIAAWMVKGILSKTDIDNRLARMITGREDSKFAASVEKWAASAVFWIIMVFVVIAFLNALRLQAVSEPLNGLLKEIFTYLPKIGGAALLLGVAWVIATLCKLLLVRGLKAFSLDDRLNASVSEGDASPPVLVSDSLGDVLYWFIFLLFLPAILGTLKLGGALSPVSNMVNQILGFLPNVFSACVIGVVGWFVARIVRMLVTKFLEAAGVNQLGERIGLGQATGQTVSSIAGTVVYVVILIPAIISALNALQISTLSEPATSMLGQVLDSLPKILTASVILGIAYVVGKIVSELVANLFASFGFDNVLTWLGLQTEQAPPSTAAGLPSPAEMPRDSRSASGLPQKTPSEIVGILVQVAFILVALIPATNVLQFGPLTAGVADLIGVLAKALVGVVVFAVGLYLANLAANMIASTGGNQAKLVSQAARVAIIALVSAMALQQMGIATNIVNLAFGLMFGSVAVAIAVAFGFGSMDVAGEQVRKWLTDFQAKD